MLAVDIDSIPGQRGVAVLSATSDSLEVIKATGELAQKDGTDSPSADVEAIFLILKDTGKVLNGEPMKRMTILLKDFAYAITLDEAFLYVVKTDP